MSDEQNSQDGNNVDKGLTGNETVERGERLEVESSREAVPDKKTRGKSGKQNCLPVVIILAILAILAAGFAAWMAIQVQDKEARIGELEKELAKGEDQTQGNEVDNGSKEEENGFASLVITPEKLLNRGNLSVDELYVQVGVLGGVLSAQIERGSRAAGNESDDFQPVDSKTRVTVNWDDINRNYPLDANDDVKTKTGEEIFDISDQIDPSKVVEIYYKGFGQAVRYETLFFLMSDGMVEFIPAVQVARTGKVESAGKLPGVEKVIKACQGASWGGNSGGGSNAAWSFQRSDGGYYNVHRILEGTEFYY